MSHQVPDKKRKQSQTTLQFQPIQKKSTKEKSNTEYNSRLKQQRSLEEEDYDYYDDTQDVEEEEDAGDQRPPKNININKMHSGFARRVPVASPTARKTPTNQPVQKLSIKPFKVKPKLPEQFEQETWEKLQEAVRAVHKKEKVAYSQEELYKAVQDMCLHKMAPSLYEKLYNQCEEHVKEKLNALVGQTPDHLAFLSMVQNAWDDHCNQMLTIRSIFLYLDRTYLLQTQNLSSLWDMGLQLFCKHVIKEPEIERKTVAGLLHLIEQERKGDQIDKPLVSSLLRMFMALGIYESSFEKIFLEETTKFYSEEGQRLMLQLNVPEYLIHVQTRLKEETERAKQYLAMSTRKPLITTVERELIGKHVQAILEKGFDNLVETNRIEDLGRLYNLLSLVNGLDNLKKFFCAYIKRSGLAIVADEEADKVMIEKLLEFKEKMDYILEHPFQNNENFRFSMKDAFETCINSRQNKPAELIAKFIDTKLKAGKGTSEDELEQIMDKVMILFRYIHGKDVFEAFYKKDLAKRLLLGRSASIDAEKSMIAKLKIECGSTFTNKLEGMFKDIELSKDIMASFRQSKDAKKIGDIDLYVNVLTTGYWPPYVPTEAKLPKDVAQCQEVFRSFYLGKHSGRRLLWQNSLGMCVLRAHYQQGNKEFSVSVFQAVVLLLFNDEDKISFKQIKEATGIEDGELRRTLQSLACAKVRVLKKNPKGREVEDDDVFSYDPNFTHPKIRIKINQIQMKETVEENTSTTEKVFKDRQYQIDAAVVRIMKSRKSLSHNILVSELFAQLKFPLKSSDLKKRIESLIDREYLERDPSNPSVYNYLA